MSFREARPLKDLEVENGRLSISRHAEGSGCAADQTNAGIGVGVPAVWVPADRGDVAQGGTGAEREEAGVRTAAAEVKAETDSA